MVAFRILTLGPYPTVQLTRGVSFSVLTYNTPHFHIYSSRLKLIHCPLTLTVKRTGGLLLSFLGSEGVKQYTCNMNHVWVDRRLCDHARCKLRTSNSLSSVRIAFQNLLEGGWYDPNYVLKMLTFISGFFSFHLNVLKA